MAVLAIAVATGAWECGDDPPRPELEILSRQWTFHRFDVGAVGDTQLGEERRQLGGTVTETLDYGPLLLHPPGTGENAEGEVFSNDSGATYWVSAEAPTGSLGSAGSAIGNRVNLLQHQYFRKKDRDATLQIVVSKAFLQAIDSNGNLPSALECPWHEPGASYEDCRRVMWASAFFDVSAFDYRTQKDVLKTSGSVSLFGWTGTWDFDAYTHGGATRPLWDRSNFELDPSVTPGTGQEAQLFLTAPITIDVPLGTIREGDLFLVSAQAQVSTLNHRQRESYLSAYLRDPQQASGMELRFSGIEPAEGPADKPEPPAPEPAPPCAAGTDPAAGVIEFAAGDFDHPELPGDGATVVVKRSGGSRGAVSARIASSDGTALAGQDYTAVDTQVLFADGEEGERAVLVPIVLDGEAEPDKTVALTLSEPGGCAALGGLTTAVLKIMDDDRPIVGPPTYSVGGTVSGLEGSGLRLSDAITGAELSPGNGVFAFGYPYPSGAAYEVRVASQPSDPLQICSVARASGTVADADVTDVAVTCVTPAAGDGLDPGFGGGGLVTTGLPGGADAMALQADGKIVLVGGLRMARYLPDGTLDEGFGDGGVVDLVFNGGILDEAHGVTIQPNGRILVVGVTRVGAQDDFAVNRYLSNGILDESFDGDGKASTDFSGSVDRAYEALVQPDGRIVVAGHASTMTPLGGDNDFAVARYTAAGALDNSFSGDGRVAVNIGGRTDLGYAAALQPGGLIVVAGRVADGGGDNPDIGLIRLDETGALDLGFGVAGITRTDFGSWDEASDIALAPDGSILVSTQSFAAPGTFVLAAARYSADGQLDDGFGTAGLATAPLSALNDYTRGIAVQADGRIVVVGETSNLMQPDFGLARFDANGELDPGFDGDGMMAVDFFGSFDGATCVAIQPDGKIVAAGFARNGTSTGLGMVRLLPGG